MRASSESGGSALLQCSQVGLSSSIDLLQHDGCPDGQGQLPMPPRPPLSRAGKVVTKMRSSKLPIISRARNYTHWFSKTLRNFWWTEAGMCLEKATRLPDVTAINPLETPASERISETCSLACGFRVPRFTRMAPWRTWSNVLAFGGGTKPNQTAAIPSANRQAIGISHITFLSLTKNQRQRPTRGTGGLQPMSGVRRFRRVNQRLITPTAPNTAGPGSGTGTIVAP